MFIIEILGINDSFHHSLLYWKGNLTCTCKYMYILHDFFHYKTYSLGFFNLILFYLFYICMISEH